MIISKINTVAQIVLAALVLGSEGFDLDVGSLFEVMMGIVAVTTLISGLSYLAFIFVKDKG